MRPAGHACVQRDPPDMAAHNLDDENAVVRLRGGVQAVDGVSGHADCGIEAKGVVGRRDVIVNGLGHADDRDAVVGEPLRALEGALPADGDQGVDAGVVKIALDRVQSRLELVRVEAASAQDRTATQQDRVDERVVVKVDPAVLDEADPTI